MLEEEEGKKKLYLLHWSLKGQARDNSLVTESEKKVPFNLPSSRHSAKVLKPEKMWNLMLLELSLLPSLIVKNKTKQNKPGNPGKLWAF